ncbi:hypothetical protein AB0H73_18635 [Streptomyces olivoreticuli]
MAPRSKIRDEAELLQWFDEGKTYRWMVEQYREKYHLDVSVSLFASYRARKGLKPRLARDPELVPWEVKEEHWFAYPLTMLRVEARRRHRGKLTEDDTKRHASWRKWLEETNAVVYYDPDTEAGFHYVPREDGDTDIVRKP